MRFVPDVHADPLPSELFGGDRRGGAAAKGVEYDVAFVAAGFNNAAIERERLLGRVAGALGGLTDGRTGLVVVPNITAIGIDIIVAFFVLFGVAKRLLVDLPFHLRMECPTVALGIKEQRVVLARPPAHRHALSAISPNDFIAKVLPTEYGVHHTF